jgi:hypothetical protein
MEMRRMSFGGWKRLRNFLPLELKSPPPAFAGAGRVLFAMMSICPWFARRAKGTIAVRMANE